MTPHPDSDRIRRAISRCGSLARPWSGDVFRFAVPRWATRSHLLTGQGVMRAGGRWHTVGLCRAVYASLEPETALAESLAHFRRFGVPIRDAMLRTLNAVAVQLHRVLDITNGLVRRRLAISISRILAEEWWIRQADDEESLTQCIGRHSFESDFENLIVPSAARSGGRGIIWFPQNLESRSRLEVVNPGELPDFPI